MACSHRARYPPRLHLGWSATILGPCLFFPVQSNPIRSDPIRSDRRVESSHSILPKNDRLADPSIHPPTDRSIRARSLAHLYATSRRLEALFHTVRLPLSFSVSLSFFLSFSFLFPPLMFGQFLFHFLLVSWDMTHIPYMYTHIRNTAAWTRGLYH